MTTINDEIEIRKFNILAWYDKAWWLVSNVIFSVSHPITLLFTNKRVQYSSSLEMLSYSYENIAGIEVLNTALHVKRKYILPPFVAYMVSITVGVMMEIAWLGGFGLAMLILTLLWSHFGEKYVYKVSLISQNAGVLCAFFVEQDETLIQGIQQAFERGKQNTVKSAFTAQELPISDKKAKTLEELKHAKELLDLGAISQAEFEIIKIEALGQKPILKIPQSTEKLPSASLHPGLEKKKIPL